MGALAQNFCGFFFLNTDILALFRVMQTEWKVVHDFYCTHTTTKVTHTGTCTRIHTVHKCTCRTTQDQTDLGVSRSSPTREAMWLGSLRSFKPLL